MRRAAALALPLLAALAATPVSAASCDDAAWNATAVATGLSAAPAIPTAAVLSRSAAGSFVMPLAPQADVSFALSPERPPRKEAPHAGVVAFEAGAAGTYRVALAASAWIDLIQDGAMLPSAGFVDFTDCPGLRKIVAFEVAAAPFMLQISDVEAPTIAVAVIPAQP